MGWKVSSTVYLFDNCNNTTIHSTSRPIVDAEGRVIASLCGHPNDPDWESVHTQAANLMREAEPKIRRTEKNSQHRRGRFVALAAGVSFGGGQKVIEPIQNRIYFH